MSSCWNNSSGEGSEVAFTALVQAGYVNLVYSAARAPHQPRPQMRRKSPKPCSFSLPAKPGRWNRKESPRMALPHGPADGGKLAADRIRRPAANRRRSWNPPRKIRDRGGLARLISVARRRDGPVGHDRPRRACAAIFREQEPVRSGCGPGLRRARRAKTGVAWMEKLRKNFTKRGVSSTAAFIAGTVSANSVQAAPAALAATVGGGGKRNTISATITTLVKGTMKTMTWIKLKFAARRGRGEIARRRCGDSGHFSNQRRRQIDAAGNRKTVAGRLRRAFQLQRQRDSGDRRWRTNHHHHFQHPVAAAKTLPD